MLTTQERALGKFDSAGYQAFLRSDSSGENVVDKFVRETAARERSSDRETEALHCPKAYMLPIEPGRPHPGDMLAFMQAAKRFVDAAANNDVKTLAQAEHDMTFSGFSVPWERRQEAYRTALVKAAEKDAFGSTQYILRRKKDSYLERDQWHGTIEAAFITACKCGSYDVVGFYLSDVLGEAYPDAVKLRPEIMAWGIYRSSEGNPSHELLEKVASANPDVARIYATQMALLSHARNDQGAQLKEGISLVGGNARFVYREAAEIAILAGHENCLRILLPEVPLYWLPELISIAGSGGRIDMVDMVIGQVEGLQKLRSLVYYGISPEGSERYFRERLLADGIRGAASTGQINSVKELASRLGAAGRCTVAAEAAVKAEQLEVLSWAISETGRSESDYLREHDTKLLEDLMTLALEQGKAKARDLLLTEKGALCINSRHIESAIASSNEELYGAFLVAGVSRRHLSLALRYSCGRPDSSKEISAMPRGVASLILDLFNRTAPIPEKASNEREEKIIRADREEAFANLGSRNEHELIATLIHSGTATTNERERAFLNAVGYNQKEVFDLLLPHVSREEIDRSFDAVAGRASDWSPLKGSRRLLPDLIRAGSKDPERLFGAARYLSNTEAWEKEGNASPAALSIINDPAFPEARFAGLLIETGLNGNVPTRRALMDKPGVNRAIGEFYEAVLKKDLTEIACLIPKIRREEEQALQQAAEHCLDQRFTAGAQAIIQQMRSSLDLSKLLGCSVFAEDHNTAQLLIDRGASVSERNVESAVERNDEGMLRILMRGKGAIEATRACLARYDGTKEISAEWLTDHKDVLAFLQSQLPPA